MSGDGNFEVGRTPDYTLSALNKSNEHKGKIGVAWNNSDGSITIKLNPFVVISAVQGLVINLFPYEGFKGKKKKTNMEVQE
jgi:hypothetical protein